MTTTQKTVVDWPVWEDSAFYNQDPELIYSSIAAQRHAAPVYWYEPRGYPRGFWVLSKYDHQRFVGSSPELFSSQYGFAIGDAADPATVMHQLPEWAQERIRSGDLPSQPAAGAYCAVRACARLDAPLCIRWTV